MRRFLLIAFVAGACHASPQHHPDSGLGVVGLQTSCEATANEQVRQGLALLHHMMYEDAFNAFRQAQETQPGCAMAYWGQAMTFVHPLWSDPPDAKKFSAAKNLLRAASRLGGTTPLERAYLDAAQAYFKVGRSAKEVENLRAFARGWERVHLLYPLDDDATLFYALGQLATADPADKAFAQQQRAGKLIEDIFASHPDHPGAQHYIIHAYDVPALAPRALAVAREYGKIAPDVPHALHMPSHIFTRLGLWDESIEWNEKSAAAAANRPVAGAVSLHYLHALDYLAYAYLQRGEDAKAESVFVTLQALRPPVQSELAVAYAFAAVPARLALERHDWQRATSISARVPEWYPWDHAPAVEAISHFARALGAAHTGDMRLARASLDRLAQLRDKAAETSAYWRTQVEIQRTSALAWLQYAEGARDQALETMRAAAALEAATEKHPVTPGEVLPAGELLADMLLAAGEYREARNAYEQSLVRSPNRRNSLQGSVRAAKLAGDQDDVFSSRLKSIAGPSVQ